MIESIKLIHNNKIEKVCGTINKDIVFVFAYSLPKDIIPKVGDSILLNFDDNSHSVIKVTPLLSSAHTTLDNYALKLNLS